jgi:hypothetical protein
MDGGGFRDGRVGVRGGAEWRGGLGLNTSHFKLLSVSKRVEQEDQAGQQNRESDHPA